MCHGLPSLLLLMMAFSSARMRICPFLVAALLVSFVSIRAAADVAVIENNTTVTFESTEANFAPRVHGSGISGYLMCGNPSDACSLLESQNVTAVGSMYPFLLTMRGNCSFETKVRIAQDAGFSAVIIYNDEYGVDLVTMAGSSQDIHIYAVFVTRESGEALSEYVEDVNAEIWILSTYDDTFWSVIVFSLIAVLAVAAALATWFFVRRNRQRPFGNRFIKVQVPSVMSPRVVEAMTSITYKGTGNQKAAQEACAICLEDYIAGEKLRVLPCSHRFHSTCIDAWLTMWRSLCPICKRDARLDSSELQVSERTPLLRPGLQASGEIVETPSETSPIQIPPTQADSLATSFEGASCSRDTPCSSSHQSQFLGSSVASSPNQSRYLPLQSSLEAFRASPYFTPPSLSHNTSPLLPNTYTAPCMFDGSPSAGSLSSLASGSRSRSYLTPSKSRSSSKLVPDA